ncbi:MAG: hypothetical protein H5U40_04705, partial [Polyangiaceae bacterium]|nr:hypothetical protein [Polyangiaceae bacterium]
MTDASISRALARLRDPASTLKRELAGLFVDTFLDAPLSTWVEDEGLATLLTDAVAEPEASRILSEHIRPGVDRYRARANAAGEIVGDLLPDDGAARIEALLSAIDIAEPPPWARGIVDPDKVRELVAPVVQETLVRFARRLPIPGLAGQDDGPSGLAGMVRRGLGESASRIADVGRSVGKSVIGGFDKKLQSVAHDFSQSALREVREAMKERLASDEGRAIATAIRLRAIERTLALPTAEIIGLLDAISREDLESIAVDTVVHNAKRALVRRIVREEIEAVLAIEGTMTVRELLERAGILESVRGFLVGRGEALIEIAAGDGRLEG